MKSVIAIATIVFALSLCNLTGKRSNENGNVNRPSGTSTETSTNENSATQEEKMAPPTSSGPPSSVANRNSNMAIPGPPRAGVPSSIPGANQNAAKPTIPKTISGGVLNGKATYLPKPAYPPIARAAKASGTVSVQVTVDESGNVISARAIGGHPLLRSSAEASARQARFTPTKLSGQAVKVTGIIVYNFVAQ